LQARLRQANSEITKLNKELRAGSQAWAKHEQSLAERVQLELRKNAELLNYKVLF
jgi:hypothetical protein